MYSYYRLYLIFDDNTDKGGSDYTRRDGVGFLPGQASLAYFFFLGSSGSSNSGIFTAELLLDAVGMTTGAAISISGAGLGKGRPILVDNEDANSPADPALEGGKSS